jgi:hypothetical protein
MTWRAAVLVLALVGCGGESSERGGAPEPGWDGMPWSEAFPCESGEMCSYEPSECLTVVYVSGTGCAIGDETRGTADCVSGSDPWIWTQRDQSGTCVFDAFPCSDLVCPAE